jgi:hypothetical protein
VITDIRTAIYTTNSVESLNRSLRKIIKIRGGFPNEEAALKLLFLALRQAAKTWTIADSSLARGAEPLHDSVAGTDAGPGENYAMNAHPTSTEMRCGGGTAPLPQAPSPKTELGRLHRSLDTPSRVSPLLGDTRYFNN